MALQINYELDSGVTLTNAYVHIVGFQGNKTSMEVQLSIYKDVDAKNANKKALVLMNRRINVVFGATMTQMYTALKTQDPFKQAINC